MILCSGYNQLRPSLVVGFGGIQAVDTEFPCRVPNVARGTIAAPLLATPVSGSFRLVNTNSMFSNFSGPPKSLREIPPGLLQHVLTVLVFWSWVLLLPRLPPSSRSLRLFPWASFCFTGPWTLLGSAARSSPTTRAKPGRKAHVFTAQGVLPKSLVTLGIGKGGGVQEGGFRNS